MSSSSSPRQRAGLLQLAEDSWQQIASFLPAPNLLAFVSTCRILRETVDQQEVFWHRVLKEQLGIVESTTNAKQTYLLQSHAAGLQSARWMPLAQRPPWPGDREGHLCVRLGDAIILTGGFTDDSSVYIKNIADNNTDWRRVEPQLVPTRIPTNNSNGEERVEFPGFVYGASLTALDSRRAVRFGGFRSGGYTGESCQVVLLTLHDNNRTVSCQVQPCRVSDSNTWPRRAARAYHTATLLKNRYLLITGGMQSRTSVWSPIVLDTHTWTWLDDCDGAPYHTDEPSGRHGHSMIVDAARQRLVLFGGGSGSDLLRSGQDNSEVWESPIPKILAPNHFVWTRIHPDQHSGPSELSDDANRLSPAETLTLGRCHASFQTSRDTVMLLFGSGRPSTNGILGYKLDTDTFFRVSVKGPLPRPRFTFASVYLPEYGYLLVHGGYCTQDGQSIDDGSILDVAAALKRPLSLFAVDPHMTSSRPVTDGQAMAYRGNGGPAGLRERLLRSFNEQGLSQLRVALGRLIQVNMSESDDELLQSSDNDNDDDDFAPDDAFDDGLQSEDDNDEDLS